MMPIIRIPVQRDQDARDLPLPRYATSGSAGMDLHAAVPIDEPLTIPPGEHRQVSTGIRIALPHGYEAQVRPRSGLALRNAVGMVNSPGTIDSDYRGVISVILINWGPAPFEIRRGDRIAQLVVAPVARVELREMELLDSTIRGDGGFGSTGAARDHGL
ncbi:MAG TPA: dUTP diphosphatase [Chthonomonadales bacterium]|nr:dUTP diphosphatase [Chthonomonadales bacterium]